MPPVVIEPPDPEKPRQFFAPNPYDVKQLVAYLEERPSESTKLIWTLNLDLTPIYAIEAEPGPYGNEVYEILRTALGASALDPSDKEYISRVSIPGVVSNRTVRLFSGQELPVVVAQPRGLYAWKEAELVEQIIKKYIEDHPDPKPTPEEIKKLRKAIRIFLDKIYIQLRNLGASPSDRALNYAGTNAFMFSEAIADGLASGKAIPGSSALYSLDTISASKSPYCRLDSDCWDVVVSFFDPDNDRRARVVWQYTIDVSDVMPVSLAPAHQYVTRL
jgi:cyanobactin maturation PatA/PatG family protease